MHTAGRSREWLQPWAQWYGINHLLIPNSVTMSPIHFQDIKCFKVHSLSLIKNGNPISKTDGERKQGSKKLFHRKADICLKLAHEPPTRERKFQKPNLPRRMYRTSCYRKWRKTECKKHKTLYSATGAYALLDGEPWSLHFLCPSRIGRFVRKASTITKNKKSVQSWKVPCMTLTKFERETFGVL